MFDIQQTCAGCGRYVEPWRGHWVSRRCKVKRFYCDVTIEDGRVLRADYHYVRGETQRHFQETA